MLVASPTAEATWSGATRWSFVDGLKVDRATYTQVSTQYPASAGWTCHVWAVLKTSWREDFLTVNRIQWQVKKDAAVVGVFEQHCWLVASAALTRTVFVGDEARTAYLCGALPSYGSSNASWEIFGSIEGVAPPNTYVNRVEFFILQFRRHGSPEENGEATGVVIRPNGYEDPNDFELDQDREFNGIDNSRDATETLKNDTRDNLENWRQMMHPDNYQSDGGPTHYWNLTIPVINESLSIDLNPSNYGGPVAGTVWAWGTLITGMRSTMRGFLLLVLYSLAIKRIIHLLTVG